MSDELTKKLSYQFKQPQLLTTALTHRSRTGNHHNERLEFLGDAVVNFIIAEMLYEQNPEATEGELSRWRATLVNRDALADLAKTFDLGKYLLLGTGEVRNGGHSRQSILSCAMEAIIGAVYLDGGFEAVKNKIIEWYKPHFAMLSTAASHKDSKTLLQEFLQSKHLPLPLYKVAATEGEAHKQTFTVSCEVPDLALATHGKGTSRRRAEQEAALAMLNAIQSRAKS